MSREIRATKAIYGRSIRRPAKGRASYFANTNYILISTLNISLKLQNPQESIQPRGFFKYYTESAKAYADVPYATRQLFHVQLEP